MGLVFSHSLATSSHHIKEVWIKDNGEEVLDEFRGRDPRSSDLASSLRESEMTYFI